MGAAKLLRFCALFQSLLCRALSCDKARAGGGFFTLPVRRISSQQSHCARKPKHPFVFLSLVSLLTTFQQAISHRRKGLC